MPRITAISRALPPYKLTQAEIRRFAEHFFGGSPLKIDRMMDIFENAEIKERYFSVPIDWYTEERSFLEKNDKYIESCCSLGVKSAEACLEQAEITARDIDYIIFVSTTGLATPSIDARLINLLKMRSDIRRTPIWGLGCAGGAAGLSHAYHYLLGHPKERALLIAVELCGLTFQQHDFSKSNFVATALFGEGASAVLLEGDDVARGGVEILGTRSTFWPDSLDVMGWNMQNTGMQVVFSRSIPQIVAEHAWENFELFLKDFKLKLDDISHLILHPGGAKVIDAYYRALSLTNGKLDLCRKILRNYGNMSSVTVLFILEEYMRNYPTRSGDYGLVSALGPGFCSESLLVRF